MKEQLSALLDGDLDDDAAQRVLDGLRGDSSQQERWDTYCLIGDALRGTVGGSSVFSVQVMSRIRSEPTLLAPSAVVAANARRRPKAGPRSAMALAASVMGVAAVGWVAYTLFPATGERLSVASVSAAADPSVRPVRALAQAERDDPHRKYVFVHQAMNGGGPISGAVQNVRVVSGVRGDAFR